MEVTLKILITLTGEETTKNNVNITFKELITLPMEIQANGKVYISGTEIFAKS